MNDDNTQATNPVDNNPMPAPQADQPVPADNPAPFTPPVNEETPVTPESTGDAAAPAPAEEGTSQEGAVETPAETPPQDDGAAPVNPA